MGAPPGCAAAPSAGAAAASAGTPWAPKGNAAPASWATAAPARTAAPMMIAVKSTALRLPVPDINAEAIIAGPFTF